MLPDEKERKVSIESFRPLPEDDTLRKAHRPTGNDRPPKKPIQIGGRPIIKEKPTEKKK
jgi:hypothetical protein